MFINLQFHGINYLLQINKAQLEDNNTFVTCKHRSGSFKKKDQPHVMT